MTDVKEWYYRRLYKSRNRESAIDKIKKNIHYSWLGSRGGTQTISTNILSILCNGNEFSLVFPLSNISIRKRQNDRHHQGAITLSGNDTGLDRNINQTNKNKTIEAGHNVLSRQYIKTQNKNSVKRKRKLPSSTHPRVKTASIHYLRAGFIISSKRSDRLLPTSLFAILNESLFI